MFEKAKRWAEAIARDVAALVIAARDPRTPWFAKVLALAVVTYALSPIDLIPDFIPVVGYLDDLLILPLGILMAAKLIPADLMAEFRHAAQEKGRLPSSMAGAVFVVSLWILFGVVIGWWFLKLAGT